MKQLIACCGLDCESCDARIATVNNDNELREKTARKWSELNNEPAITAETINCMGAVQAEQKLCIAAICVKSANAYLEKDSAPAATVKNWIIAG